MVRKKNKKKGKKKTNEKTDPKGRKERRKTELERRERSVMTPLEMMLSNQT